MTCNKWPKPTRHSATVAKNQFRWTARIVYLVFHVSWWTTFARLPSLHLNPKTWIVSLTWGNRLPNDIKQSKKTIKTMDHPEGTNSTSCLRRCWNMKAASCCQKKSQLAEILIGIGYAGYALLPGFKNWSNSFKLMKKSCSHWSRDAQINPPDAIPTCSPDFTKYLSKEREHSTRTRPLSSPTSELEGGSLLEKADLATANNNWKGEINAWW